MDISFRLCGGTWGAQGDNTIDNQANIFDTNNNGLFNLDICCCFMHHFPPLFCFSEEMEVIGASHYREHPISIAPQGPVQTQIMYSNLVEMCGQLGN